MDKFQNKYRVESHRLKGWDYSQEAIYFITICTQDRICWFGNVETQDVETHCRASLHPEMILNDFGKIVEQEILNSVKIRENWLFHEWVIMPNHVHFLIEIVKTVETHNRVETQDVETHGGASLQRKPKSISSFVALFKAVTTKQINQLRQVTGERIWQRNYHDHIVRNYPSFCNIKEYIHLNPDKWDKDTFHPKHKVPQNTNTDNEQKS